jgi:hydrogenase maturation protease
MHATGKWAGKRSHAPLSGLLVLGFGNILLGDDGAGVRMLELLRATRLQARARLDADARREHLPEPEPGALACYLDAGTMSFSLLSYVEDADALLALDAAELDAPPGSIALFEDAAMDRFLRSTRRRTVHEVGLADLLDMARVMNCLPRRRALLCIQPGVVDWSGRLSAPLAAALPAAVAQAQQLFERWRLG